MRGGSSIVGLAQFPVCLWWGTVLERLGSSGFHRVGVCWGGVVLEASNPFASTEAEGKAPEAGNFSAASSRDTLGPVMPRREGDASVTCLRISHLFIRYNLVVCRNRRLPQDGKVVEHACFDAGVLLPYSSLSDLICPTLGTPNNAPSHGALSTAWRRVALLGFLPWAMVRIQTDGSWALIPRWYRGARSGDS